MANIDLQITNLAEIRSAFGAAPALMEQELNKAIQKTLFSIQGETILNVHPARGINVVTRGLLSATERPPLFSKLKGVYDIDINYAKFVHDGTRFMKARPFLKKAVDAKQNTVDEIFRAAVNVVLSHIGNKT